MSEMTSDAAETSRATVAPVSAVLAYEVPAAAGEPDVTRAILWGGVAYAAISLLYVGVVASGMSGSRRSTDVWLMGLIAAANAGLLVVSAGSLRRGARLTTIRVALPTVLGVMTLGLVVYYGIEMGWALRLPTPAQLLQFGLNTGIVWLRWMLWPVVMCWCLLRKRRANGRPTLNELILGAVALGALDSIQQLRPWTASPSNFAHFVLDALHSVSGTCTLLTIVAGPAVAVLGVLALRSRRHKRVWLTTAAVLFVVPGVTFSVFSAAMSGPQQPRVSIGSILLLWFALGAMPLIVPAVAAWTQRPRP